MKVYIVQVIQSGGLLNLRKGAGFYREPFRPTAAGLAVPLPHGRLHRLPHLRGQYHLRKIRPQGRFFRADYFNALLY